MLEKESNKRKGAAEIWSMLDAIKNSTNSEQKTSVLINNLVKQSPDDAKRVKSLGEEELESTFFSHLEKEKVTKNQNQIGLGDPMAQWVT